MKRKHNRSKTRIRDLAKRLVTAWDDFSQSSLLLAVLLIMILLAVGTAGYIYFEQWSFLEALYATVITVTTVGYGDYSPQTIVGRIFAIGFTLVAIGVAGYAISTLAAIVFENQQTRKTRMMRKRRMDQIMDLDNHTIVCGSSVIAHRASNEFLRRDLPFIIIEPDEETLKWAMLWMHQGYVDKRMRQWHNLDIVDFTTEEDKSVDELADELNILYLLDDPKDEQVLRQAGIERANGLLAVLQDDLDNMAVILSARDMAARLGNPNLRIVARIHDEWNSRRMKLAGADHVFSPNIAGGVQLANSMLHPVVNEFWDHMLYKDSHATRFIALNVDDYPQWIGQLMRDIKLMQGQLIVAIKRADDFIYIPSSDEQIMSGDVLISMQSTR